MSSELESNYREVLGRIEQAAGSKEAARKITLIAVSKTKPAADIEALYHLGHRDFGENYVQEMLAKATELATKGLKDIRWHFIGHLQTNKVKMLLPHVYAIHSVDSEKLALEISKRAKAAGRTSPLPVFIEVNVGGEETKTGLPPSEVPSLASFIGSLRELTLQGLMAIPPPSDEPNPTPFRMLRALEEKCRPNTHGFLSMGMTDDLEVAVREGATHVRVGTAIFGKR
jgi:pyridoxal phosphate enzyme (YggS family)